MLFVIFFKDHHCQMTLKSKKITSSRAIVAATLIDGTPPQKILSLGRE